MIGGQKTERKGHDRGTIERRGNSLRVKVYAGVGPLTGKDRYLRESTTNEKDAERILTRLLAQVDADRHAKTNATLNVAIDEWMKLLEVEDSTRETYEMYSRLTSSLRSGIRVSARFRRVCPAEVARKPRQPAPQPTPPTPDEAAQIIEAAWNEHADWGTLIWLVMVTGMRRAEVLALRWNDLDLTTGTISVRRNYVRAQGRSYEKDTKTHRMRRVSLDPATVEVVQAHRSRYEAAMHDLGAKPPSREE